jgi:thymidylate synthase (FAD)
MKAELLQHNNDDLFIANVARASFAKWHDTFTMRSDVGPDEKSDEGLVHYLANHKHISPFFHPRFTFEVEHNQWMEFMRDSDLTDLMGFVWEQYSQDTFIVRGSFYGWVKFLARYDSWVIANALVKTLPVASQAYGLQYVDGAEIDDYWFSRQYDSPRFIDASFRLTMPIFVARQMFTHRMFATNEVSRRYVTDELEFFPPDVWRAKPEGSIKQGSSDKPVEFLIDKDGDIADIKTFYGVYSEYANEAYKLMLDNHVAPEMARMLLPQSMHTTVIFTGSLHDWAKVYHLRTDNHAQKEIKDLLHMVDAELSTTYGDLWTDAKARTT